MVTGVRTKVRALLLACALPPLWQGELCRGAHAAPSRVEIRGPHEMHLARSTNLELTVQDQGGGSAEPPARLAWLTNVGRVDAQANDTLLYTPASKHFPQVAIIAAYDAAAQTPVVHFIQLVGSPTVEVKSEPNVSVTVQVGNASFGPQRTNGTGIALVPIEVPPGVTMATTVATDSHGNVTRDDLPLEPPSYPRLLTLCASEESAVYVIEVNSDGKPAAAPTFRLQSATALTESATPVGPGVFRVAVRSRELLTEPKRADIRASTDDFSSACSVDLTPPPVALPYTLTGNIVPIEPAYPWFLGIHAGWLTNTSRVSGPWLSVRGAYAVSKSHSGLRIELEAGVSQSSTSVLTTDNQELELNVRTVPIFASARYALDWGMVHPMAAINLGAAITRAEATGSNVLTDESFATPWLGGSVGGAWWLGHHEVMADVGYAWAKHSSGSVLGNVAGLKLTVGYQYAL
jgi:hypothetical protein